MYILFLRHTLSHLMHEHYIDMYINIIYIIALCHQPITCYMIYTLYIYLPASYPILFPKVPNIPYSTSTTLHLTHIVTYLLARLTTYVCILIYNIDSYTYLPFQTDTAPHAVVYILYILYI